MIIFEQNDKNKIYLSVLEIEYLWTKYQNHFLHSIMNLNTYEILYTILTNHRKENIPILFPILTNDENHFLTILKAEASAGNLYTKDSFQTLLELTSEELLQEISFLENQNKDGEPEINYKLKIYQYAYYVKQLLYQFATLNEDLFNRTFLEKFETKVIKDIMTQTGVVIDSEEQNTLVRNIVKKN